MTKTEGMKSTSKSFDPFEFKVEEDLAEESVRKIATDFGCTQTFNGEIPSIITPL